MPTFPLKAAGSQSSGSNTRLLEGGGDGGRRQRAKAPSAGFALAAEGRGAHDKNEDGEGPLRGSRMSCLGLISPEEAEGRPHHSPRPPREGKQGSRADTDLFFGGQ